MCALRADRGARSSILDAGIAVVAFALAFARLGFAGVFRHGKRWLVLVAALVELGGSARVHRERRVAQLPLLIRGLVRPAIE